MAWHTVGRALYRVSFVVALAWLIMVVGLAAVEGAFWQLVVDRPGATLAALALFAVGPPALLLAIVAALWRLTQGLRQ